MSRAREVLDELKAEGRQRPERDRRREGLHEVFTRRLNDINASSGIRQWSVFGEVAIGGATLQYRQDPSGN